MKTWLIKQEWLWVRSISNDGTLTCYTHFFLNHTRVFNKDKGIDFVIREVLEWEKIKNKPI